MQLNYQASINCQSCFICYFTLLTYHIHIRIIVLPLAPHDQRTRGTNQCTLPNKRDTPNTHTIMTIKGRLQLPKGFNRRCSFQFHMFALFWMSCAKSGACISYRKALTPFFVVWIWRIPFDWSCILRSWCCGFAHVTSDLQLAVQMNVW